jgi:hypothetical protein
MDDFGLEFVKKLKPCKWKYKAPLNDGKDHFGFIAQEVAELAPKDDYGFVGIREGYFTVNYMEFIGPIVKAIQELDEKVDELQDIVAELILKEAKKK